MGAGLQRREGVRVAVDVHRCAGAVGKALHAVLQLKVVGRSSAGPVQRGVHRVHILDGQVGHCGTSVCNGRLLRPKLKVIQKQGRALLGSCVG